MKRYLILLLPALLLAKGPDRGGYRWVDSDVGGGPVFNWVDITASGTRIPLGDDDNQGPFALGFSLDFYGRLFDAVRVCSNGWLSFVSESHQFHHYSIPDGRDPNSLLASFWADLDPTQGGSVFYLADSLNHRFIISWVDVRFSGINDSCTFQVVLDTGGTIVFQYLRVPATRLGADSCSVGIENESGLTGLEYLFDGRPAENRLHDSLAIRFYRLQHDACPTAVLRPMGDVFAGDSVAPLVTVWNAGLSPATFPVTLTIGGYEEEITVAGLPPLSDTQLQFPVWIPALDSYTLQLITSLGGDEYAGNDTLRKDVAASYSGELRYDDGEPDTWFCKNGSPTNDWAGVVRFSVPYDQFRLRGARIHVAETEPFSRVLVCPDSSGSPMLGSPFLDVESVAASVPKTWLEVEADTQVATADDVWLVAFWPPRATGPRIGEDRDAPLDGRAYYGSPSVRWIPYATGDLMARLRIEGSAGVSEVRQAGPPRFEVSPNPFRRSAMIGLGAGASRTLHVRDGAGRRVRDLDLSESGGAVWDGCDQAGRSLPAGTYFIVACDGSASRVARIVKVH